jgi:CBS domain-containing protein
MIWQWSLQRLGLVPWRAHPHIAFLLCRQDHRHQIHFLLRILQEHPHVPFQNVKSIGGIGVAVPRHLLRRRELQLQNANLQTRVDDIMERNVVYVGPDQPIEECMALMTTKRLRHLPVIENGELLGIVSIGDLVKSIISDREFVIEQLEHYIRGSTR